MARRLVLLSGNLPWLVVLAWLASAAWFLCDDAFISFRYARNLVEGHGLVFNPGERVEGYTNFLWVLELAALWKVFGLRPENVAPWLSALCTIGTLGVVVWWAASLPGLRRRGLVTWMALGLLCTSATFAVWTSGGGLETRQFTLFAVVAVVCLSVHADSRRTLLAASLSLAAAAYTRPEGLLVAVCCFGWFVAQRVVAARRLRVDVRELCWLVLPFVAFVGAQFLFRYGYYGEWLPNTYYAKHVRPWYESGFNYLWAAAIETGLYLLMPLAAVAMRRAWRESGDLRFVLPLACIVPHMAYVFRIGGDYFEYRPLDFYWPLLAVPAAAGTVRLGSSASALLRRLRFPRSGFPTPGPSQRLRCGPLRAGSVLRQRSAGPASVPGRGHRELPGAVPSGSGSGERGLALRSARHGGYRLGLQRPSLANDEATGGAALRGAQGGREAQAGGVG